MAEENIFKDAAKRLYKKEDVKKDDPDKELKENIRGLFEARQKKKDAEKDEKKYKAYLKDKIKVGEKTTFGDIGLQAYLEERNKTDFNKEKLIEVLEDIIKKNPEVSDVLFEKKEIDVDDQLLQKYMEDGKISKLEIEPCLEVNTTYAMKVKKY